MYVEFLDTSCCIPVHVAERAFLLWMLGKLRRLSLHTTQVVHQSGAYLRFLYFCISISTPPVWDAIHCGVTSTHLYTEVKRGTVRVKCLVEEHSMSPARARTQTARSGGEGTKHEATAPIFLENMEAIF